MYDESSRRASADDAARALARQTLAKILADPTVTTVPKDAPYGPTPSFIRSDRLFRDLAARGIDAKENSAASLLDQNEGARLLNGDESDGEASGDDRFPTAATVDFFRDVLQLEILDFSSRLDADAHFDIARLLLSPNAEEYATLKPVTVFTLAPFIGSPFGAPTPADPPSNLPRPLTEPPQPSSLRFAVLDTGAPSDFGSFHSHLKFTVDNVPGHTADDTPLYSNGIDQLLMDAGHGLFIWDVAYRRAPQLAPVCMPRVLSGHTGRTLDEQTIVREMQTLVEEVVTRGGGQLLVNMSFSGTTPGDSKPAALDKLFTELSQKKLDVLVVAAAGNDSNTSPQAVPFYANTTPHWPAAFARTHENVVSVGALDAALPGHVAHFSNRGSWVTSWANGTDNAAYVPGQNVSPPAPAGTFPLTPDTEPWAIWQGTSFAVPRVAAAVANHLALMPGRPTLLEAWNSLRSFNVDNHPTWRKQQGALVTEPGVIVG